MRVVCPFCSEKALITSSNSLTKNDTVKDLYCSCTNAKSCGATFVFTLSYKHVLTPPAKTTAEIALNIVSRLSEVDKETLKSRLLR